MTLTRRAVLHAPNNLQIEEVKLPELQAGEVLLKVTASLLCGTDVRIYTGQKTKNVTLPSTLGHEFAGTIEQSAGPLPEGLALGDQVCVYPLVPCGRCVACTRGHENICQDRVAFGYQLAGGLSQYVIVPANARQNLVPLPGVGAAEAAIVEPIACAYNGQMLAGTEDKQTLLVVGCGPLGLIHIRLAKALGVSRVCAIDPIESRREMAIESGAERAFAPGQGTPELVKEWSNGGIDVLIAAIGRPQAITDYLGSLAPGAAISAFAGFGKSDVLSLVANDIHYNEWKIVGASSCRLEGFHRVAELVASGKIRVKDLIGTQLPLDQSVQALDLAASGKDMRVGVDPWR